MNAKWIFFDVGSTLVDEEAACTHRIRDMIKGTNVTFEEFSAARVRFMKEGYNGDMKAIEHFGLTKTPWHSEDEVPYPDAASTLEALCERGYKLGVIANQELGTEERLRERGLLKYFCVVAASAELGVAKPDKRIFTEALKMAGCEPFDAVMVGDRLDNDIAPAKALGMTTVRINKGIAAYATPQTAAEIPDYKIADLSELLSLFT